MKITTRVVTGKFVNIFSFKTEKNVTIRSPMSYMTHIIREFHLSRPLSPVHIDVI